MAAAAAATEGIGEHSRSPPPGPRRAPTAATPCKPRRPNAGGHGRAAGAAKAKEAQAGGVGLIVQQILEKCTSMRQVEKYIDVLRRNVGQSSSLGFTLSAKDVSEARSICISRLRTRKADAESSSDESDSGSDGERIRSKDLGLCNSLMDQGAGGSDSEDLSGEEEVDEEACVDDGEAHLLENGAADSFAPTPGLDLREGSHEMRNQPQDECYPSHAWNGTDSHALPGSEGFNRRSTAAMQQLGIDMPLQATPSDGKSKCPPLQPHQKAVAFLLHPSSPVTRLLIDHPTGSGKTREIIKVLDNYYNDPRPKVPIFPKNPVCRNFYSELLRWPNRYRDYFCCERPADAAVACGQTEWREVRSLMWDLSHLSEEESRRLGYEIREVLEMKNMFYMGRMRAAFQSDFEKRHPGEQMPAAPMRALSYTSAGGTFTRISEQGRGAGLPASALMKIGYEQGSGNVYANKVVVMDEVHNLVRTNTQYAEQLQCLRDFLFKAGNLVLGGFTGTPILNEPAEGRKLLDIVKGHGAPACDEGFLSSFPMRPRPLFPQSLPRGIPDAVLSEPLQRQLVCKVELHEEALRAYERKRRLGLRGRRLQAYCNVSAFFGSFHDGKSGTKERILGAPGGSCPKLYKIAEDVAASPQKALILISRQTGYIVMLELMRMVASRSEVPFAVATIDDLAEFNHVSNLRGEKFRVLVADASQCSEGVSFFAVRRTFLADVPASPSQLIQQCGRAIRMYGHRGLPEEEQTVTNRLYVATLPRWMRSELASWSLRAQRRDMTGKDLERSAKALHAQLLRSGITSLAKLKGQVDEHGSQKRRSLHPGGDPKEKEALSNKDMTMFLEMSGLWEDEEAQTAAMAKSGQGSSKRAPEASTAPARAVAAKKSNDLPSLSALASGSQRLAALSSRLGLPLGTALRRTSSKESLTDGTESTSVGGASTLSALETSSQDVPMSQESSSSLDDQSSQGLPSSQGAASSQGALRSQALASSQQSVSVGRPLAPMPRAAAGVRHPLQHLDKTEFALLGTALEAARVACEQSDQGAPASSYLTTFEEAMRDIRQSRPVHAALRASLPRGTDPQGVDLRSLSARQVMALRDHFTKAHGLAGLTGMLVAVRSACDKIDQDASGQDADWRRPLGEALEGLQHCAPARDALEAVLPGYCQSPAPDRFEAEHLRLLLGELARRKAEAKRPSANSRHALVRAAKELYAAASLGDATSSLSPETADEQALCHLAERTQDFSTALEELRAQAVDREVFARWAAEAPAAEAEAAAPEGEESEAEEEPQVKTSLGPVKLPPGWRATWEVRKKSETFLVVDPKGKKYSRIADLRAALQGGEPTRAVRPPAPAAGAAGRGAGRPQGGGARKARRRARW